MPRSHFILLIEDDPLRSDLLATQLVRLGVEPIRVADFAEALAAVKSKEYLICAVLIPSELGGPEMRKALKKMRRKTPLRAMVYGKAAGTSQRKLLRKAGVPLALWDGYDESMLRFQVNRLVSGDSRNPIRGALRAPTCMEIRILIGGREKQGVLYSISETGCFIETPRASVEGAQLYLTFRLGDVGFQIPGTVIFSTVPGNLQRLNLPLGMGVGFDEVSDHARSQLADFVRERLESLEV